MNLITCPKHGKVFAHTISTGRILCPKCGYSEFLDRTLQEPESDAYKKVATPLIKSLVWGFKKP